jgi:hypothetical protein
MITRSQMRRQLRAKGGIMNAVPRQKYGIGDFVRKLIPNELADIAVKAAPFVAPFNPGIAAAMRGIGRYDQRGSISDALKQGLGTYVGGQGLRMLGGAGPQQNFFGTAGDRFTSPLNSSRTTSLKNLFQKDKVNPFEETANAGKKIATGKGVGFIRDATGLFKDVPILKNLPSLVKQQILVGGATSAATYLYSAFIAEEPPQQEGETMEEYLARRKENVGKKMRSYFDNYFKFDKEYSSLDDAGKDAFVARYNMMSGGRAGYQTGGITMANTLAENMRRNLANQQAVSQQFQAARSRLPGYVAPQRIAAPTPTPIEPDMPISKPVQPPGGDVQPILPVMPITQPIEPPEKIMPMEPPRKIIQPMPPMETDFSKKINWQPGQPAPEGFKVEKMLGDEFLVPDDSQYMPPTEEESLIGGPVPPVKTDEEILTERELNPPTQPGFLSYNDPLPKDQLLSGFEQFKKDNPEVMQGAGTAAMVPVTLPGGYSYDFTGSLEANAFRKYLESIRQAPYQSRRQPGDLAKLKRLAGGGMPMGEPRVNQGGITELDYRAKGGFVPVGIKEKADDVPAMLSKNEFVFTADAVRGAGNGSVEKGAQKMYDTMKNLERRVT